MKRRVVVGLLSLALSGGMAYAHHSPATYDLGVTDFAVKGKVNSVEFPGLFCIPAGMPSIALGGADYPVEIIEQVRRTFVNGTHPEEIFLQRNGHSIGRWEGNVFVVDTIGMRAASFGSVPHSNQAHVVERWQRIDTGRSLVNELTIHDLKMYSKPVVLRQYYKAAAPDSRMMEYECTEGRSVEHEKSRGITPD